MNTWFYILIFSVTCLFCSVIEFMYLESTRNKMELNKQLFLYWITMIGFFGSMLLATLSCIKVFLGY